MLKAILWFLELIFGGATYDVALEETSKKYDIDRARLEMHIERGGYYSPSSKIDSQGRFNLEA